MVDGDRGAPQVISHYRLDEEIGRGGMGTVYRATDLRDGSFVAVKLLRSELSEDPSYRVRFQREAHVAALLRSPYTVHLTDYGLEGGRYFLAMDFVEGRSLREELRDGPLDVLRALQVAETVARALEEAEARGVVHRDIKPDNIMLGEDDVARVLDFGIARQAGTRTLTVAGGFVGSFPYASPEQAAGDADRRSDIYSLGATLYQALSGSPPFSGTTLELIEHHRHTPMPEESLAGVPEVAIAILRRCLAKDPKQRYQTASSLAGALSEAMREIEGAATAETADAAPAPAETEPAAGPWPPSASEVAAAAAAVGEPAVVVEEAAPAAAVEGPAAVVKEAPAAVGAPAAPPRPELTLRLENGRPRRRFGLRTGGRRYDLHVWNEGDTAFRTTLTASDAKGACRFKLPGEVDTQPGKETVVQVEVRPQHFRWRGGRVRSDFVVAAEGGGGPPAETRAGFDDTPPLWPMAGGGFLVVAAVVVAVVASVALPSKDPGLFVLPASLDFGPDESTATLRVSNLGDGTLFWTLSDDAEWLDVIPGLGFTTGGDSVQVFVSRAGLASGTYTGTISIASNGGSHVIDVTMEVAAAEEQAEEEPETPVLAGAFGPRADAGGRIAFASDRDGDLEIYVMNADGSALMQLTDDEAFNADPAWSPDGDRIAFASDRDGDFAIYVMNADGSDPLRLTTSAGDDVFPAWSPDGNRIAFVSNRDGDVAIYVMNADGSDPLRLTTSAGFDADPAWSPDGNRIAFVSNRDGDGDFAIYVMNAMAPIRCVSRPPLASTLIPPGRDGDVEIYVMNADGSDPLRLTTSAGADAGPAWSPDGDRIAFASARDGDGDLAIYVMNGDGSDPLRLTTSAGADAVPAWAPVALTPP